MNSSARSNVSLFALTALSLSIGWGIRGNFGHEIGAMTPGALGAMAAVLMSGRDDWLPRIAHFGFFGALGWSFGGSISYMHVIGYTHSGDSMSVLYGFACLFVIGFLWGAVGGAGTAMPALLNRDQLQGFFGPLSAIFIAWIVQDVIEERVIAAASDFRQESPLYWYDTDWLAALLAVVAVVAFALIRRRWSDATSLILHMAIGWWCGFLLLVLVLGWRMTPPRGDNWAGCVGMVGGMLLFFQRRGWTGMTFATLLTGFVGGFGFAVATLFKLIEIRSGWNTNWHSILEQTYGLINGLGIALTMFWLARRGPKLNDERSSPAWTDIYAVSFVLVGITFLNLRRLPSDWIKSKLILESMYGWSTETWFSLSYLALGTAVVILIIRHFRKPLTIVPQSPLGRSQMLYLSLLWWMVIGNLARAMGGFTPQRLVTEGVIHVSAIACTVLAVLCPRTGGELARENSGDFRLLVRRTVAIGTVGILLSTLFDWGVVRAIYGDQFAGHAGKHIRFGPNATTGNPPPGSPHP